MKRMYLMLVSVLFMGGLMAQSITSSDTNKEKAKKQSNDASFSRSSSQVEVNSITKDLPGFPEFVDTGDREKDCATFNAAMEKWMSSGDNKKKYDEYLLKLKGREAVTDESKNQESK